MADNPVFHSASRALRTLRELLPDAEVIQTPSSESDLYGGGYNDPPTIKDVRVLEGTTLRAIPVDGDPVVAFAAFLDGVQQARIISHRKGIPIVSAVVAAAIRVRINRRLITWKRVEPLVHQGLYMPLCYLPELGISSKNGIEIVDTALGVQSGKRPSQHPGELRAAAMARISSMRDSLEQQLANAWCTYETAETAPLFVDGGISGSERVATSGCVVGVIKSHQTMYAKGDLETVMSLKRGERSSVFAVEFERRTGVMSWYLRVRDPRGRDALFGLVRVEVAMMVPGDQVMVHDIAARANEVSRWILAESAPLSLPDSRWDKMMYGVRDCEEFLRAIST